MDIYNCKSCNNKKFIVSNGECRSCIQEDLSDLEYDVLEYLYMNNSNSALPHEIEDDLDYSNIVPKLESYKLSDYNIVEVHRLPARTGHLIVRVELVDEKAAKYIIN